VTTTVDLVDDYENDSDDNRSKTPSLIDPDLSDDEDEDDNNDDGGGGGLTTM
jgi:hypothetical protein